MMRKLVVVLALLAPLAGRAEADSPVGLWRTEAVGPRKAYLDVRVAPCGDALCGTVAATHNTRRTDLVGQVLMTGMVPDDDGGWSGGTIVAPDTGKSYAGTMRLDAGGLRVQGCVAVLCRTQTWERLN
ncbi:DUF2147 domain-containing protein [Amaricoccus solimangrovi]|nr:DUF2147 domain-containing protein [Amaricoccus solimangrovi]